VAGLRALTFAALAAVTAAIAHGGLATLADPRWATAALSGAGVAALVMWRGWALVARWGKIEDTASLAALIPAMLAAQTAAHLALLAAGAPAHPGVNGSLALHLALAVVAAVVVQLIDVHTQRRALAAPNGATAVSAGRATSARRRSAPRPGRMAPPRPSTAALRLTRPHPLGQEFHCATACHAPPRCTARSSRAAARCRPGAHDEAGDRAARAAGAAADSGRRGRRRTQRCWRLRPVPARASQTPPHQLVLTFDQQIRPVSGGTTVVDAAGKSGWRGRPRTRPATSNSWWCRCSRACRPAITRCAGRSSPPTAT
jgi:hypothetical protein